jgi:hypothetical protein
MRKRVYISGPISSGGLAANLAGGKAAGLALMRAGFAVLLPHLHAHYEEPPRSLPAGIPHSEWLANDLPWVAVCDAVLRLPGDSVGAEQEVSYARLFGVPVFASVEELIRWRDGK